MLAIFDAVELPTEFLFLRKVLKNVSEFDCNMKKVFTEGLLSWHKLLLMSVKKATKRPK